jgi:hypothetical protein
MTRTETFYLLKEKRESDRLIYKEDTDFSEPTMLGTISIPKLTFLGAVPDKVSVTISCDDISSNARDQPLQES